MAFPEGVKALLAERKQARRLRRVALAALVLAVTGLAAAALSALVSDEPAVAAAQVVEVPDLDGDGLPDVLENAIGTNPAESRGGADLPEAWVVEHGLNVADRDLATRAAAYPRGDESPSVYGSGGLPPEFRMDLAAVYAFSRPAEWNETSMGPWDSRLDPRAWDVGGSGVPYSWLIHFGLDPFDTAALDRVAPDAEVPWTPREAYERGLHPRLADGDADGLPDVEELALGTSPRTFSTGGSGIADGWLHHHAFDLFSSGVAYEDTDRDGLTNREEFEASMALDGAATLDGRGLDPRRLATRGGPIPDGWFVAHGLDPLRDDATGQVTEEEHFHGPEGERTYTLTLLDEYRVNRPVFWDEPVHGPWMGGSDPRSNDTDEDGVSDIVEILGGPIATSRGPRQVESDPTKPDTDGDGLDDFAEWHGVLPDRTFARTDPSVADTDRDGLGDGVEVGVVLWRGLTLADLDPNDDDTDDDGIIDGAEAEYWSARVSRYRSDAEYEWGPQGTRVEDVLRTMGAGRSLDDFGPMGDLDDDGVPNVLDPDSDGDGLHDGQEIRPELYLASPFASEHTRPATDPGNRDTDLDALPDGWEMRYGIFDARIPGWNLDPSLWSSFGDDVSDAERDLDDDGATWYSFHREDGVLAAVPHVFTATNRVEHERGSDPNRRSSSPDGIADGWKVFWGYVYPTLGPDAIGDVYPGAPGDLILPADRPTPTIGMDDETTFGTLVLERVVLAGTEGGNTCAQTWSIAWQGDAPLELCGIRREHVHDLSSVASHATNPYLVDTDGDGAPDDWEIAWSILAPTAQLRVSPVREDAHEDLDEDGLSALDEFLYGSDPYEPDSDQGGVPDGVERRLALRPTDPVDDARALDPTTDTDGDGLTDAQEIDGVLLASGARVHTSPLDVDTDLDGLLDGRSWSEGNGRPLRPDTSDEDKALVDSFVARGLAIVRYANGDVEVPGELTLGSDPTRLSTSGDGVPDGWAFSHWRSPEISTGLHAAYAFGRPAWWNESQHGTWNWGLEPGEEATSDLDRDGLDDRNGEDPIPFANAANALPEGDPREEGLNRSEALRRAQAYGGPTPPPAGSPPRASTRLDLEPIPGTIVFGSGGRFSGNLTTSSGAPVANATVVLALGEPSLLIGVAITNESGSYEGEIVAQREIEAPEGSEGIPVFGEQDGSGIHQNLDARLPQADASGEAVVFAWSYNQSVFPPPRQNRSLSSFDPEVRSAHGAFSDPQNVTFRIPTSIQIEANDSVGEGASFPVVVTLADALGRPLPNAAVRSGSDLYLTDERGRVALELVALEGVGLVEMLFDYAGGTAFEASNATLRVHVLRPTELRATMNVSVARPGDELRIEGALHTPDGLPVGGAPVALRGPGVTADGITDEEGSVRMVARLPTEAALGPLVLNASYAGNETLAGSSATLVLRVSAEPRWLDVSAEGSLGAPVAFAARLVDHRGAPLPSRNATISFEGASVPVRTDAEGWARAPLPSVQTAGERVGVLRSDPHPDGQAVEAFLVRVTTDVKLEIEAGSAVRGRALTLHGSLRDALDRPIARQPLRLVSGEVALDLLTDANGTWTHALFLDGSFSAGTRTFRVESARSADGIYRAGAANLTTSLVDEVRLTFQEDHILLGHPVLPGRATTLLGEPIQSLEIRVTSGAESRRTTTRSAGEFKLDAPVGAGTELGPLRMTFETVARPGVPATQVAIEMPLLDEGTVEIDIPPYAVAGATLAGNVTVTDSSGRQVAAARVDATLDGERVPTTLQGGRLRIEIPSDAPRAPATLRFEVEAPFLALRPLSTQILVQGRSTMSFEEPPVLVIGQRNDITVVVMVDGRPVANETVLVTGAGPATVVPTDADGRAVLSVFSSRVREDAVTVSYLGSDAASASSVALRVDAVGASAATTLPTWAILGAGVLVLGAIVGWQLSRRRRSAVEDVLRRTSRKLRSDHADVRILYDAYLSLLGLLGLEEDTSDHLTFAQLLERAVHQNPAVREHVALLSEVFNEGAYATHVLSRDRATSAADALDAIARSMDAAPS